MKKILTSMLLLTASSVMADSIADSYFKNSSNPTLNRQEQAGLRYAHDFSSDGKMATPPGLAEQGRLMFPLNSNPSVVCAVFQVCDIALQPGEQVNSLNAGDTARWDIQPAISGNNGESQYHILVKPFDVGLSTTLFIATDRRTYHIRLKSHKTKFMPAVGFIYPEDQQAAFKAAQEARTWDNKSNIMQNGQRLPTLTLTTP